MPERNRRAGQVVQLPLDQVEPNPFNVRLDLGPAALRTLATSIRERGLIHPILVRPHPDPERFGQYQIVCGERRYRAFAMLRGEDDRFAAIPARVDELDDRNALAAILEENELRADWSAFEKATFFRAVYDGGHFPSIRGMARAMGVGLTTLHRYLRIFDLPPSLIEPFRDGRLGLAHMEVIVEAPAAVRGELLRLLFERPLGKADARRLARRLVDPDAGDWRDRALVRLEQTPDLRGRAAADGALAIELRAQTPAQLQAQLRELLAATADLGD